MRHCQHKETYAVPEEESRLYGNNYDVVTVRLDFYCTKCDTHTSTSELTRQEPKALGIYSKHD